MCLRDAAIPVFVDSSEGRITGQLEVPALRFAATHNRISGFWQLSWLKHAADGLEVFVLNKGAMKLLIGLPCDESYDDLIQASRNLGSEEYRRLVREEFARQLVSSPSFRDERSRTLLEKLIASRSLQMKILPEAGPRSRPEHGKLQIYYDECVPPCWVLAGGSKNDSDQGDSGGVDFMAVHRSWNGDQLELRQGMERYFEGRWNHENAVELGEETASLVLERLREPPKPSAEALDTVSVAFSLLERQRQSEAVVITSSRFAGAIQAKRDSAGLGENQLAVLPVEVGPVLLILSQYLDEKPVAVFQNTPTELERTRVLWQGPPVSLWGDRGEYLTGDSRELDMEALWTALSVALDLPDPPSPTPKLYEYNHPSGPQEHQRAALELWRRNGRRALLEHATGTYKTATGLTAAAELLTDTDCNLVVIAAPQIAIADNWATQALRDFDHPGQVRVVRCYSGHGGWREVLEHHALVGTPTLAIFVNDSLWKRSWWGTLRGFGAEWGLIADEAHNWVIYGRQAAEFMEHAPSPTYRLALTAQLVDSQRTDEGEQVIEWFAGSPVLGVHPFGLEDAIGRGFLRPYDYQVEVVPLERASADETLGDITARFEGARNARAASLAIDLCRTFDRVLLYTGPTIDDAKSLARLVRDSAPAGTSYAVETFTSRESPTDRRRILRDFRRGLTKILVAVRCLDEGVDLPVADAAVMCLANEDERQWVQRRGRILRVVHGEEQKAAKIVDFLPRASLSLEAEERQALSSRARGEVRRALTFARLARPRTRSRTVSILEGLGW